MTELVTIVLVLALGTLAGLLVWLLAHAVRSLATMAEVMEISHADEIKAFRAAERAKMPPGGERRFPWPEGH